MDILPFVEQLRAVPEFANLGNLFKSSTMPVELTESETEYVVQCIKHTFGRYMVFQVFWCLWCSATPVTVFVILALDNILFLTICLKLKVTFKAIFFAPRFCTQYLLWWKKKIQEYQCELVIEKHEEQWISFSILLSCSLIVQTPWTTKSWSGWQYRWTRRRDSTSSKPFTVPHCRTTSQGLLTPWSDCQRTHS